MSLGYDDNGLPAYVRGSAKPARVPWENRGKGKYRKVVERHYTECNGFCPLCGWGADHYAAGNGNVSVWCNCKEETL